MTEEDRELPGCPTQSVTVSRLMNPDDANISGNVHGGNILKLLEEAGGIIATRFCNHVPERENSDYEPCVAVLARVERKDFLQPMHIGEVAELTAEILFTSSHSLEVGVTVQAEDLITGKKRITNRGRLWYVPLSTKDGHVMSVPSMTHINPEAEARGRQEYEQQKIERKSLAENPKASWRHRTISFADSVNDDLDPDPYTVAYSRSQLIHWVGASDVSLGDNCKGGVFMKLMDECAGIVAIKHCKTPCVTASFDATNFHQRVGKGGLITVTGEATFTSNKAIEIEVVVDVEVPWKGVNKKERAVDAFITFVSLDANERAQQIPQLIVRTEGERARFEAGRMRNEKSRKLRLDAKKATGLLV